MPLNFEKLANEPRMLLSVPLEPVQGPRFQPTGFPDLGAATYQHGEKSMLLVESAQSMANRLEAVCWDEGNDDLQMPLKGLPYVKARVADGVETNSILEAHRLNSPYIVNSSEFEQIRKAIGFEKDQPFDRRKLAEALFKYDPSSLVHGVFLEKVGGVVRLPRALSAFIESENAQVAAYGGVKFDRIQPETTGETTTYGKAKDGYGNVPYHRDDFTGDITAYFNLDLALIRGYGVGTAAEKLLIAVSLYKIRKFLRDGLRLRTACDLKMKDGVSISSPKDFKLPELNELEQALPDLIKDCATSFPGPRVTEVNYKKK